MLRGDPVTMSIMSAAWSNSVSVGQLCALLQTGHNPSCHHCKPPQVSTASALHRLKQTINMDSKVMASNWSTWLCDFKALDAEETLESAREFFTTYYKCSAGEQLTHTQLTH